MKRCPFCNAKNKTSALFCSQCGKEFCVVDVGANRGDPQNSETFFRKEKFGGASGTKGAGVWSALVDAFSWFSRVAFVPLARAGMRGANAALGRALAPTATWDPTRPPNFLYWGIVQALITRLPSAFVGVVYAVLAKTARADGKFADAVRNANRARIWLLIDLGVWVVLALLRR